MYALIAGKGWTDRQWGLDRQTVSAFAIYSRIGRIVYWVYCKRTAVWRSIIFPPIYSIKGQCLHFRGTLLFRTCVQFLSMQAGWCTVWGVRTSGCTHNFQLSNLWHANKVCANHGHANTGSPGWLRFHPGQCFWSQGTCEHSLIGNRLRSSGLLLMAFHPQKAQTEWWGFLCCLNSRYPISFWSSVFFDIKPGALGNVSAFFVGPWLTSEVIFPHAVWILKSLRMLFNTEPQLPAINCIWPSK